MSNHPGVDGAIIDRFIREQAAIVPRAFEAARTALAATPLGRPRHVTLVGSGTSFHALLVARELFEIAGAFVSVANPGSFLARRQPLPLDTQIIALSQTGTSTTTVAAVQRAQELGAPCIVMTAERDSPIARVAKSLLAMPIGAEPIGPKTKGYTGSLAALFAVAEAMGGAPVGLVGENDIARVIDDATAPAFALAETLDDADHLMFVGEGRHYGSALEASLKIAEMTGVPSSAFSTEEAMHGRFHGLTGDSLCVAIAADDAQRDEAARAAKVMSDLGVRLRLINLTATETSFDWLRPSRLLTAPWDAIAAIAPVQRLAQAMATRRGIAPHTMRFPGLSRLLAIKIDPSS